MLQIADLVLFPMAKAGYAPEYRPYAKLAEAGKLIDFHLRPEDRSSRRSEEHTSELQSLMRISYAVFCLKKKKTKHNNKNKHKVITNHKTPITLTTKKI